MGLYVSRQKKSTFRLAKPDLFRLCFCLKRGSHTITQAVWKLLMSNSQGFSPIRFSLQLGWDAMPNPVSPHLILDLTAARTRRHAQSSLTASYFKSILILFCSLPPEELYHLEDFSQDSKITIFAQRIAEVVLNDFAVPNSPTELGEIKRKQPSPQHNYHALCRCCPTWCNFTIKL